MSAKNDFKEENTMDNVNNHRMSDEEALAAIDRMFPKVAEDEKRKEEEKLKEQEEAKKGFTFKKAIKYVVAVVVAIVIYNVFFTTSSIDTVKNTAFMNSYGNATTDTIGEYFVDGKVYTSPSTLGYDWTMSDVKWSSESNDMGTGDIVTLSYYKSAINTKENDTPNNNIITIKWFLSDDDDSVQCVSYTIFTPFTGGSSTLSDDDAQEELYDMMKNGRV